MSATRSLVPFSIVVSLWVQVLYARIPDWSGLMEAGNAEYNAGRFKEAERLHRRAAEVAGELPPQSCSLPLSFSSLANDLRTLVRMEEAQASYEKALKLWERCGEKNEATIAIVMNNYGMLLRDLGRYSAANDVFREALLKSERVMGANHRHVAMILNNMAALAWMRGLHAQSASMAEKSLAILKGQGLDNGLDAACVLSTLADANSMLGRHEEAEKTALLALDIKVRILGPKHPQIAVQESNVGSMYFDWRRYEEAEYHYRRALEIEEATLGRSHPKMDMTLGNLGAALVSMGQLERGERDLRRALALAESTYGSAHPHSLDIAARLADLLRGTKRGKEAAKLEAHIKQARASRSGEEFSGLTVGLDELKGH